MRAVAVITARGGSKRIPRKNVKPFLGVPIIQYSIKAALSSGLFEQVMVSTDDPEIAKLAIATGAAVPFMRSEITSDDFATTADVLVEVLRSYASRSTHFDYVCCIYPTAPFVTAKKLTQAWDLFQASGADSLVPVVRFGFPIWRSFKMEDTRISFNWPENAQKRSQDLPPTFHDCGQFYFLDTNKFLQSRAIVTANTVGFEISELEVQDIDNETDWKIAEIKYSLMLESTA